MKKLKIATLSILLLSTAAFIIFSIYDLITHDGKPPVIKCSEEITVSVEADEEELLKGVTAKDDKSGDVSDSLVVEKISDFIEDNTRIVTYAAIDEKGNVGRKECALHYTDYQSPQIFLNSPLRFDVNKIPEIKKSLDANSVLDGNIGNKVKYSISDEQILQGIGIVPIELSVTDSAGKKTEISTILELYDKNEESIEIELSNYLVYIKQGSEFYSREYIQEISREGRLSIESNVDVNVPGVYQVDYTVEDRGSVGKTRLIVVVEE